MIDRFEGWLRNLRRALSRSEWSARRLGLSVSEATESHAGLVLVHLENVGLHRLQDALGKKRFPFFNRLLTTEGHRLLVLDRGPCSRTAREACLFYGVENVPVTATSPCKERTTARELEERLAAIAPGLLAEGSQYGGVLSGGARSCHFSVVQPGWGDLLPSDNAWSRAGVLVGHSSYFFRAAIHAALKSIIAPGGADGPPALRGAIGRELSVMGATIDVARGLPIIHVNLSGYADVVGPRRMASCAGFLFRDMERALRAIWLAARRSARRDYDVWIYSTLDNDDGEDSQSGGFVLLPADAPLASAGGGSTLQKLRDAALHVLGRAPLPATARPATRRERATLRVMTYNVHSCVGMDGKLSPARIARVIARCDPDVVALQELDVGRVRTGAIDQAQAIARELKMEFHFHPALAVEEELYGDAILSRFPMRLRRAGALPGLPDRPGIEPRGALWVTLQVDEREIQFFNTHLGLVAEERLRQVEALLNGQWLQNAECRGATILCGDFNALPRSRVCRRLSARLADAQLLLNGHRPKHTFFGRYPIGRIDHVFVSSEIEVLSVEVPRNDLVRRASDHLPLVVELRLKA